MFDKVSEEFLSNEQEFKYTIEQMKQTMKRGENDDLSKSLDSCKKCIKMMETELQTVSIATKKQLQPRIVALKKQLDSVEESVNELLVKSRKVDNLKANLYENDLIIEEIDKLTTETESIALNVDGKMKAGTQALQQTKEKKQDLKSNLRKTDFTITMMNNKITLDKVSLIIIIILLGIIDVFAIYKKVL